jgi:Sulfatase
VMQCLWEQRYGWTAGLRDYVDGLQTFDGGRLRALLDGCRTRGVFDDALVIVTSDHGEGRCAEGYGALNHAQNLLDDTIRIPLLLRVPGASGASITVQVSQADVMPTLLDLLGLPDARAKLDTQHGGRSLVPLLRGKRLPPAPAYAELSVSRPARAAAVLLEGDPLSVVRFRVLRSATRKVHLTGQLVNANGEWLAAPAETFVRSLYRDVLGRFEAAGDLPWWLDKLRDEGSKPDIARRQAILHDVEHSPEGARTPKYAIYDLECDPLEENPRTPASGPLFWPEYRHHVARMHDIERRARPGAPLLALDGDDELVRKRLQALGYVE